MDRLTGLQPESVFEFFDTICDIPHGSGNTEQMLAFLEGFAKERELDYKIDAAGNIVIFKGASEGYEKSAPVILQGHMDMVCASDAGVRHDFEHDVLDLGIEGDYLYAEGTSLGGDDGIAVAYMLAVLDDDSLAHPPIEAVFTNDEEVGLLGASAFDAGILSGRRMINLDSEAEGILTCGCAGGSKVNTFLPLNRIRMKGLPVVITISGLQGGHSGEMIGTGRANAGKLMGRFLTELESYAIFCLENVYGGEKDNIIMPECKAHLVLDEEDYEAVSKAAVRFERDLKKEYRGIEEGISVGIEKGNAHKVAVLDQESQDRVIKFLEHVPFGVRKMSSAAEGLVETSSNIGVIRTGETEFACVTSVRSSVQSGRKALELEVISLTTLCGGRTSISGEYPEWEYRTSSSLRDTMTALYKELYGDQPKIEVVHAGLECGIFSQKIRGLDAVSIGPDMKDIHSPNEKLSISSTQRVWNYLTVLLSRLK